MYSSSDYTKQASSYLLLRVLTEKLKQKR